MINEDNLENYEPTRDGIIDSFIKLTYSIKYQYDENFTKDKSEETKIKKLTQEKMYYNVMREGNCWIFSILLTMKKVVLDFIGAYSPSHKIEDIAYHFRQFINNSLKIQ